MSTSDYLYSASAKKVLRLAEQLAAEYAQGSYSSAHILWALTDKDLGLSDLLGDLSKDSSEIRRWALALVERMPKSGKYVSAPPPDALATEVLREAQKLCLRYGIEEVNPLELLEACITPNVGFSSDITRRIPIALYELIEWRNNNAPSGISGSSSGTIPTSSPNKGIDSKQILGKYCEDLTKAAQEGKIDPLIGREKELKQLVEILGKRLSPNVLILGEPGVGKTAIIGGLAMDIIQGRVPESLKNTRIFELDVSGRLVAGAYKGEVEERLKSVLDAIKSHEGKAILFIDEIHTLLDEKGSVGTGVVNLLKPELARGEITVIGATTQAEFQKFIEKDSAFSRRFSKLIIPEPEVPLAVEMIEGLAKRYEDFHQIKIHSEAIGQAVKLSKRYIGDKNLPVSAIEIIDLTLACARQMNDNALQTLEEIEEEWNASDQSKPQVFVQKLKNRISELLLGRIGDELDQTKDISSLISKLKTWAASPKEEVVAEDIESVISYRIGIPLGKLQSKEQDKFKNISEVLSRRVVGQDHVIEAVSKALKSFRTNLKDPKDPGAIFFFVGPTGTGKTELAKSIAELLFDDENSMIRFDMSEFQESHSVAALLGSPPGYVGYEEGGLLVNKIRKQPYSVLLFDEIEKAHGDIYGIFLQMLTDSRLQDKQGRLADFSNTIIIFTSNAGADQMVEAFQKGETLDSERLKQMLRETRRFKDEFLGRVDSQILPFAPISESVALSILKIHFGKFAKILKTQHNINLSATDALLQHLVKLGFSPLFGARPLRNAIKSNLTPVLADLLINGTLQKGDDAEMDLNEAGEIIVHRKAQAVS